MYVKYPLSLRNVEDLLHERGIDICHETVRFWWNRFGPLFASDIRRQRANRMRGFRQWQWHLDEMYVKVNGEMRYLWRAVDHEGEVLESFVTKERDKAAALRFIKKAMKRYGNPEVITTDGLRSYKAAMTELGNAAKQNDRRPQADRCRPRNGHRAHRPTAGRSWSDPVRDRAQVPSSHPRTGGANASARRADGRARVPATMRPALPNRTVWNDRGGCLGGHRSGLAGIMADDRRIC